MQPPRPSADAPATRADSTGSATVDRTSQLCDDPSMSNERVPLVVRVSDEIALALQEQNVDLVALLRDEGHTVGDAQSLIQRSRSVRRTCRW